jgi:alkanesulfonate monooxygenase SsuD/methylene tetrahydromethanopterin reductase-like flavin-dependent oxidoreductase (luciferase family)
LQGSAEPPKLFRDYVELFVAAEELGFDSVWVAQHHFESQQGRLPSPFPFLAAVAERTTRVRLGTAVVTLPLEDPVRVAEDAAVLDALSGGRLELGVGSGSGPDVFGAFGKNFDRRREDNSRALTLLSALLSGDPVPGTDLRIQPAAPRLRDRLWQAAFSQPGARYVGGAGSRLLLNRATFGKPERTDEVQAPWAEAYLAAYRGRPDEVRIGLSRGVYPAADKQTALEALEPSVLRMAGQMVKNGLFPAGLSLEDYCERLHISYGNPEEVAERLSSDRVLPFATELILQFSPASPPLDEAIKALELLATQIAPSLGWHPHP